MLRFTEGFDAYATGAVSAGQLRGKWAVWSGAFLNPNVIVAPGRSGAGRCIEIDANNAPCRSVAFTISGNVVILGFNLRWGGNAGPLLSITDGPTTMWTLSVNAAGQLTGTGGLATIAAVSLSAWVRVEVKVTLHDTTGAAEARINHVPAGGDVSGVDTIAGGAAPDGIMIPQAGAWTSRIDDITVADTSGTHHNDWIGPGQFHTRFAAADDVVAWTPQGAGTNAAEVDEDSPDDDATYNEAAAAGLEDFFTHAGDLDGTILALGVMARAKDADASTLAMRAKLKSNGTEADGPTQGLATEYGTVWGVFEVDPDTGGAWSLAAANAAAFGYESL